MADAPGDLIELYRARGLPEAHAVRGFLEAEGVPARIENEFLQGALGDLPLGWSTAPRILVPRSDEAAARAVLAEFLRRAAILTGSDAGVRCLACHAPMGDAAVCPACGWSYETDADETGEPGPAEIESAPPEGQAAEPDPVLPHLSPAPPGAGGWGEVAAVLAVGVVPNLMGALTSLHTPAPPLPYWLDAAELTVLNACPMFVVLYLIRRGGEPWARFGVDRLRFSDFPFGIAMFVLSVALVYLRVAVLPLPDEVTWTSFVSPRGPVDHTFMVLKYAVGAYSEELITRAYLITRLTGLLGSPTRAVVLAALAFSSYHVYQGVAGTVDVFVFGLVFGVVYLLFGRIWPLVIGHALSNIMADLMSP
jgi:membrane protease YdiL (CAAX protease family)